ncbi:hypothetical protein SAICODRAFT_24606 [Saitoella complicata NRRL Y-17804]|uniref:uncharacterized protein n=1 Tax=Saitoella complicata (strain BCRC 22490 / CBS 7301 / JCM 7358 / NBRC 10748 / NRRL Y-17804) TaxID=698492 RepID=UPI0008680801|nr:uncharacterized protein SAICODRAFT_24606 [Saitoella complicata NRRL Y-17804]ODQ53824.1 hypothetical protein SAICODRAFT_24606 [Saitoella complicata NRRL Y-17804]
MSSAEKEDLPVAVDEAEFAIEADVEAAEDAENASGAVEGGEDEYEVEKILGHRWSQQSGDSCRDMLEAYWQVRGGRAKPPTSASSRKRGRSRSTAVEESTPVSSRAKRSRQSTGTAQSKAHLVDSDVEEEVLHPKRRGRKSAANDVNAQSVEIANGGKWTPPTHKDSWEEVNLTIDTIARAEDGELMVYVDWNNGYKTVHRTDIIYDKCPRKS